MAIVPEGLVPCGAGWPGKVLRAGSDPPPQDMLPNRVHRGNGSKQRIKCGVYHDVDDEEVQIPTVAFWVNG